MLIHRRIRLAFIAILLTTAATTASAQGISALVATDSTAVVRVASDLLRAISTRDTLLARRLLVPGMQLVSIPDPASLTNAARTQNDSQFVSSLAAGGQAYLERLWNPTVFLQGSLAVVRAPYDFYVDRVFSHCGVDVFTLVRSRGEWRISHVVYTTQRQGCAASPLGPAL